MHSKFALFVAVLSQALPSHGVIHEKLAALPLGWTQSAVPSDDLTISLHIGLAQQNIGQLQPKLLAVSTPGNTAYGHHLDVDDVNSFFAPTNASVRAVKAWLSSAGISNVATSSDGHWITFSTTIGIANTLLSTTFLTYENSGVTKIRTTQYSIPDSLTSDIDLISPTTYFGKAVAKIPTFTRMKRDRSDVSVAASCKTLITPTCIKELYSVGNYAPDPKSGSRVGFGSFLNQSALYADLADYEAYFDIPSQNFSVTLINGGVNNQDPATAQFGEASPDVQGIIGVSHPLPVTEFITGGSAPFIPDLTEPTAANNTNEPYLPYYQYLLSQPNSALPQVISNSYGEDEQTVPLHYAIRVCNMIGMLGLRGITVLESSGDSGVGTACKSNDGKNITQFTPQFPSTCPYILAIGGTQGVTPEVAWDNGSGGFSNYFTRPWYQDHAVENYLNSHISPAVKEYYKPYANFTGRGFPDVSAHSLTPDYKNFFGGVPSSQSGGTSAAAPVVAGIIALLNDARLRASKSTLGFVNPALYAIGYTALNDIVSGSAVGCNGFNNLSGVTIPGAGIIPYASWNATIGWDPATGLGTPNFEKLKKLVLTF